VAAISLSTQTTRTALRYAIIASTILIRQTAMNESAFPSIPVLRLDGVSKSYGAGQVLQDVDIWLQPGSFTGLVGVNGAGKTTLIKCLLDFCNLDGGKIEIFGQPHNSPEARRRLAFLPERFTPPYFLSGREFVRTMLEFARIPFDEDAVRTIFDDLDLDATALDKPVRSFSKGMTQKLGLAACFLSGRDFYLFDEPMSGLDPKARARVKGLLTRLRAEGKTVLFTSHSLADIEEICDYMLVLHRGGIAFSGAPLELRERFGVPTLEHAFLRCIEANG
jgi:ABC-2 type transport system ATP-binding protein